MSQQNVDVVRSIYDAFESGDVDEVLDSLSEDVVAFVADGLPWSGTFHGREGFRKLLDAVEGQVQLAFETDEFIDAGEDVAQIGHGVGEVHVSGKRFNVREIHIWGVHDGKVVSFREYSDTAEQRRSLGFGGE